MSPTRLLFLVPAVLFLLVANGQNTPPNTTTTATGKPFITYPQYSQPEPTHNKPLHKIRDGWNLSIGMDMGVSELHPQIDFERTALLDAFNFIKAAPSHSDYDWDTFVEDYDLKESIRQPRFGFSGLLTYGNIPAFVKADFISSSSSYQKMSFSVMGGIGKDVIFGDDFYFSFLGGYKIVFQDSGFGSETIVNSIGNDEGRKYLGRFFDPKTALGSPRGDMMSMRVGLGKYLGHDRKTQIGAEIYGDLDLTNETLRIARMNTVGLNAYVRFVLF